MARKKVTIQDAIIAVTCVECSMQKTALLGSMNALHTKFPDDPEEEYKLQAELILKRLGLNDLLDKIHSLPNTARQSNENEEHESHDLDHGSTGDCVGNSSPKMHFQEPEGNNSRSVDHFIIDDESCEHGKNNNCDIERSTKEFVSRYEHEHSNVEQLPFGNHDGEESPSPGTITSQAFDIERFNPETCLESESTINSDINMEMLRNSSSELEDEIDRALKTLENKTIWDRDERRSASVSSTVSRLAQSTFKNRRDLENINKPPSIEEVPHLVLSRTNSSRNQESKNHFDDLPHFAFEDTKDSSITNEGTPLEREFQLVAPPQTKRHRSKGQESKDQNDVLTLKKNTQNESQKDEKKSSPPKNSILNLFQKPTAQRSPQLSTQMLGVDSSAPAYTSLSAANELSNKDAVIEKLPTITCTIFSTDELSDDELDVTWPSDFLSKVAKGRTNKDGYEMMSGKNKRGESDEVEEPSKKKRKEN